MSRSGGELIETIKVGDCMWRFFMEMSYEWWREWIISAYAADVGITLPLEWYPF